MIEFTEMKAENSIAVPHIGLAKRVAQHIEAGWRIAHLTARRLSPNADRLALIAVMISPGSSKPEVWEAALPVGSTSYESLTEDVPSVHWYERFIYDLFGLHPEGHPRFKSVIFHEGWPDLFHPLSELSDSPPPADAKRRDFGFLPVHGEGVFEIPVGPIHAGIIEPGHFRFSCLGEVIQNLDIRLGYLHRGIERRLEGCPIAKARLLAEAASTDTTAGNALAHAHAVEDLCVVDIPTSAINLRAIALEIERVACHVSDLGGVCADIGFLGGASAFGRLRARVLGFAERLTASRFQTAYIVPGGVARPLESGMRDTLLAEAEAISATFDEASPILLDNYGALERMEGIGRLRPSVARDLGILGPAGRASGLLYDVRERLRQAPYMEYGWSPSVGEESDVYARVRVRALEVVESLALVRKLLAAHDPNASHKATIPAVLRPNRVGVGIVEAWRGELIHMIFTGPRGEITRYAIKEPSTNNWSGLANAVRGQLVTDFPICNKSFGLSYSGNDL